ncbi:hypothetical protein [Streptomyces sp. NRRL B-24484]|uniref:hypothetical protein n=1 Tax=Streptomyces sp. NRRL B-24484 TaxID=1463833 RepID=UPI0006931FA0|nr:hypothetical protein [Streptomyces sp. NRRL B-24484]
MDRPTLRRPAPRPVAAPRPPEPDATEPAAAEPPGPLPGGPPRGAAVLSDAEEVLVVNYRRLARIAYLVLPAGADRRRRLLRAHAVTQRALAGPPWHPAARRGPAEELYEELRDRVVRRALAAAHRPGDRAVRLLPQVWGLRLTTVDGGPEAVALDRALAALSPAGRAAYALRAVDGLPPAEVRALLLRAGETRPDRARREAVAVPAELAGHGDGERFDPCTVRVQPGDLIRRRRAARVAAAALLLLPLAAGVQLVRHESRAPALRLPGSPDRVAAAPRPDALVRADPGLWRRTARLDHSAWPARGDRTGDRALLGRALAAWDGAAPAGLEPGTAGGPPAAPPHLLYAGTVDGDEVVLLSDGGRIARWTDGRGLQLARADDSDVTTAAALVLHRTGDAVRYLLAPWVAEASLRSLRAPDTPARPLGRRDGVTDPVPAPPAGSCPDLTALQLRSSRDVAEDHAFLLADLGGLAPAHLTYTPPPATGAARAPRAPREATGTEALTTWARTVCALPERAAGVKALNAWAFAVQPLPQLAGTATWVCLRTDRWNGTGSAATELLLPGTDAARTGYAEGRGCSRFDQDAVAWSRWHAPDGQDLLLVAASRRVVSLTVHEPGAADRSVRDRTLVVDRPGPDRPTVEGARADGTPVRPLP